MDLNLLQLFSLIYQERNLTRAAERLCISPSAVSHGLRWLRDCFGDALFTREAQGVVPTPLAMRIWPDVQAGLGHLQRAVTSSEAFEPTRDVRCITLAMNDELKAVLLPKIHRHLLQQVPDARLESVRIDRAALRSDLAASRIDCAIDVRLPSAQGLTGERLAEDDWVVACRSGDLLDLESYVAARHVTVSSRRTGMVVEDYALAQQDIERRVVTRCQSYAGACRLVAAGNRLLSMPRSLAQNPLRRTRPSSAGNPFPDARGQAVCVLVTRANPRPGQ